MFLKLDKGHIKYPSQIFETTYLYPVAGSRNQGMHLPRSLSLFPLQQSKRRRKRESLLASFHLLSGFGSAKAERVRRPSNDFSYHLVSLA